MGFVLDAEHGRIRLQMARRAEPAAVVGNGVDGGRGRHVVLFSWGNRVRGSRDRLASEVEGAIASRAAGADVDIRRFDVFSSDGATVVREPVGAMVSSEARAEVDDESDGAMVPSAGKADTDSCAVGAIVSRPVDASVASPIDVGAAEKADGDGGAPAATRKEGIVPANELVDNKPGTMFRCVEATTPRAPISKEQ